MSEEAALGVNWYTKGCKFSVRNFRWLVGDLERFKRKTENTVSQEFIDSLNFTGLDVEPYETRLFSYMMALIAALVLVTVDIIYIILSNVTYTIPFSMQEMMLLAFSTFLIPLVTLYYFSEYPKMYASYMRIHSLGDTPEVLSYIVMSMKLTPNLENSIKFAADNCERQLSRDLRKLMWDLHVRVYSGIEDALASFADRWGRWSEYFKRSIHLIKSSTSEPDEAQRVMTLNRSLDVVLDGTRSMMEDFANRLHQPTVVLFSIFIMIPLALVAMLPAAAVVGIKVGVIHVVFLYNMLLPLVTFIYSQNILTKRPAAFTPPEISEDHPLLQKVKSKRKIMISSILAGFLVGSSGFFLLLIGNPGGLMTVPGRPLEGIIPYTFPIIWGIAAGISFYCIGAYYIHKKIRDEIRVMEKEFSDALFVLGRRISEGRSAEDAFSHAAKTMEGAKIAEMLDGTSQNLISMRTTLRDSLFDEEYGSLRNVYSDRIKATMKLFVESVRKSHEAAGVAITKLADHLKELQEVEERIKRMLYDVTSMMRSTMMIFAPLIGGVTVALSEVISKILAGMLAAWQKMSPEAQEAAKVPPPTEVTIPPEIFVLCIGLYMIFLTIILTRFAGSIEDGGDKPQFMYKLGHALPFSILVFTFTTVVGRFMFGTMVP